MKTEVSKLSMKAKEKRRGDFTAAVLLVSV